MPIEAEVKNGNNKRKTESEIKRRFLEFERNILNSFTVRPVPDYSEIEIVEPVLAKKKTSVNFFTKFLAPGLSTKIIVIFSIVMLNWLGLSAIGRTLAYFDDNEISQNSFQATSLDFSLNGSDFSPAVTPSQNATSTINLENIGLLDFTYNVKVRTASGTLCSFLELEDNLSHTYKPLSSFVSATTTFSAAGSIIFDARLTSANKNLQNKLCEFKFVFDGEQLSVAGFSDTEEISRTITSGEWPGLVINKIYYDVDDAHGTEEKNEWVELYNPTDQEIDISNWTIADNSNHDTLASSSPIIIPSLGYAIVTNASTTWNYWNIPAGVIKIEINSPIGNGMANSGDRVILKNLLDQEVDAMSYGSNITIFNPAVPIAPEGHLLARAPSGFDTDRASDWQELTLPTVSLDYPIGGEVWYVGHTYNLRWSASSTNESLDSELKIDLYYSNDSGKSWAAIATSTENDGTYNWKAPLFLDYGHYYVPSPKARVKVVATGPENFMVQSATSSKDFCPPIDYDAISPEEQDLVDQLVRDGVIDPSEVIRGGVKEADLLAGLESNLLQATSTLEVVIINNILIEDNQATTTIEIIIVDPSEIASSTQSGAGEITIVEEEAVEPVVQVEEVNTAELPEIIVETPAAEAITADPVENQEILNTDSNTDEPIIIEPSAEPVLEPEPAPEPEPIVEAPPAPETPPEPASVPEPAAEPATEAPATD